MSFYARPRKDNTRNRKIPFQKKIPSILAFGNRTLNHEIIDFFGLYPSMGTSSALINLVDFCRMIFIIPPFSIYVHDSLAGIVLVISHRNRTKCYRCLLCKVFHKNLLILFCVRRSASHSISMLPHIPIVHYNYCTSFFAFLSESLSVFPESMHCTRLPRYSRISFALLTWFRILTWLT